MKRYTLIMTALFLITTGTLSTAYGQEKTTSTTTESDSKIQKSIEQQKKTMAEQKKIAEEQKKASEDVQKSMKDQQDDFELQSEKMQIELDQAAKDREKLFLALPRGNRSFKWDAEPFVYSGNWDNFSAHFDNDSERTSWDLSRNIKEKTFSREYAFDVDKTTKSVVMSVMGDCKSGDIRIKIIMPNGKNYSDIVIDESGNLNWRKSFTISETENQDRTGDWKFQITSNKATGYFKISLQAF